MSRKFDEVSKEISNASTLIVTAREKIKNNFGDLTSIELETLITESNMLVEDARKLVNSLYSTSTINSIISKQ